MKKVNFNTLFNEIYSKHGKLLEDKRKKVLIKQVIIIAIFVSFILIVLSMAKNYETLIILLAPVLFTIMRMLTTVVSKKYKEDFKETAIKILVEGSGENYQYSKKRGVTESKYRKSDFDNFWDYYSSEDLIEGNFLEKCDFEMSQIKTERIVKEIDNDGHVKKRREVTFFGVFGVIKLPVMVSSSISIGTDSILNKYNKNRIEMESAEFETNFDVFSDDRLGAMEILTRRCY